MRPPMPSMMISRRAKIALWVVAVVIVLIIVLVKLSGTYINYLWFEQVGHTNVYSTVLWTRVSLFFIFGVLMALIIGGNLVTAYVIKPPFRPMSPEQQNLQHYMGMAEPRRKLILGAIMAIALLAAGASAQGDWQAWQLWLHGGSFGVTDPQFHKDISFYAFDYPVYRLVLGFGFSAIIFSIILSVGIHYLTGAIRLQTPGPKVTIAARRHLTALVFVFMAFKAVAYWLDRYGLVFSARSKFTGASYTDVHSELPAKTILFWITIILAIGVLASIWLKSALLPGIGFVALLVVSILIGGIYPAIVQSVSVNPNASEKEKPYISDNITATRNAYDIATAGSNGGTVTYKTYGADSTPDPSALTTTNTTIDNIRILDPNLLSPTFNAQQKIALPYTFAPTLNVDRYKVKGATHDYIVAVREHAPGSNLTGSQNNWINQHTVYTHGYGFVAARADVDVTNGDKSSYTEGEIPPTGPLGLTQPDVYFGQLGNNYAIVGAKDKKVEYDGKGSYDSYTGGGGISLSNPLTKLAFALHYKDTHFLLNDTVSAKGARIIYVHDPRARLKKVAPFLTVDSSPYPVVDPSTGHIVWMLDGYTTMANYPYSERESLSQLTGTAVRQGQKDTQINYIRNSVKATVDAYTGKVTIYQWQNNDPLLSAWMKVFPGLVKPMVKNSAGQLVSQLPTALLPHVRYPQDFFDVQRGLLAQYHITKPVASYNGTGKWAVPPDPFDTASNQPPYYVLARQPNDLSSNAPEFQLTSPMVVNGATNLAAYISADSDPADYGKLTVLQVNTSSNVYGPSQVANDLKSTAVISKDIAQLSTGQSTVLHGNLLTLPVGNSFLYVEPLYVESTGGTSAFPTLQRVLVRYGNGNQIGYGSTLTAALDDIRNDQPAGSSLGDLGQTTGNGKSSSGSGSPPTSPTSTPTTSPPSSGSSSPPGSADTSAGILNQLETVQAQLAAAKKSGNFAQQAQALQKQSDLVQRLLNLSGSPTTSKPTTSQSSPPKPSPTPTK